MPHIDLVSNDKTAVKKHEICLHGKTVSYVCIIICIKTYNIEVTNFAPDLYKVIHMFSLVS